MSILPEELLKLILSEVKDNNKKIDDVREYFDEKLEDIQENISKVIRKTDQLDIHVTQTKNELENIEHTVKGNGSPGLKTKVEFLEVDQKNLKKEVESLVEDLKKQNSDNKKNNATIKVAWITAGVSGVVALLAQIITYFS